MTIVKYGIPVLMLGGVYAALPERSGPQSATFSVPAPTARARLQSAHRVIEGTGLGSLTVQSAGADGDAALVGVTRAGQARTILCRVVVAADGPGQSRATVDCAQPGTKDQPTRAAAVQAMTIVVGEHVAASITQRPYDIDTVANRMMALVASNVVLARAALEQKPN